MTDTTIETLADNVTLIHAEQVHAFDAPSAQIAGDRDALTKRLIDLTLRKRELDAESRKVGEVIDQIERELLDAWIDAGRQSERIDGVTVYIAKRTWATAREGNRQAVVAALESLGMADMVTFNTQTLSAWFKERAEAGEEVPQTLAEVVSLEDRYSLNVRKGK